MGHSEILILGAGPAGLGAAWRLHEVGHPNWRLITNQELPGGWASSIKDLQGFTWNLGGPLVDCEKDPYFRQCLTSWLGEGVLSRPLNSKLWRHDRLVSLPLEDNLEELPAEERRVCQESFRIARERQSESSPPRTFFDWAHHQVGESLAEKFAIPYAEKLWGLPAMRLGWSWANDYRIPLRKSFMGPTGFLFSQFGKNAGIWQMVTERLPNSRISGNERILNIDSSEKRVNLENGETWSYDHLISTLPLDQLAARMGDRPEWVHSTERLTRTRTHCIGIGMRGEVPGFLQNINRIFFPGHELRAHKIDIASSLSADCVPGEGHWSLLCEVSFPSDRPLPDQPLPERMVKDLRRLGIIRTGLRVVSLWQHMEEYGQPTPFYGCDEIPGSIMPRLKENRIYSCGRFGSWNFEKGNPVQSFMQGKEAVDIILQET